MIGMMRAHSRNYINTFRRKEIDRMSAPEIVRQIVPYDFSILQTGSNII